MSQDYHAVPPPPDQVIHTVSETEANNGTAAPVYDINQSMSAQHPFYNVMHQVPAMMPSQQQQSNPQINTGMGTMTYIKEEVNEKSLYAANMAESQQQCTTTTTPINNNTNDTEKLNSANVQESSKKRRNRWGPISKLSSIVEQQQTSEEKVSTHSGSGPPPPPPPPPPLPPNGEDSEFKYSEEKNSGSIEMKEDSKKEVTSKTTHMASTKEQQQEGKQASSNNNTEMLSEKQPEKKKRRKSRWEQVPEEECNNSNSSALVSKPVFPKELTLPGGVRVTLPPHLTGDPVALDPEVKVLHEKLNELNCKLQNGILEMPPEHERSPSPEPIYDRNGIRLNTREVRLKEKITQMRNEIIEDLIMKDPLYKPPPDYKPQKKYKKIPIPQTDFPGYNFIGLIIGPRGNTQKRMQKETNTKIAIRGKGSVKDGANRDPKYDYGEEEELHVLITGDKQEDVDAAAKMVEDLLKPMDEERNEHKRLQLRELAQLNGTLKDDQGCYLCSDPSHKSFECPNHSVDIYKLPSSIQEKVDALYQKDIARANPDSSASLTMDLEYKTFLAQLGGDRPDIPTTNIIQPPPPEILQQAPPPPQPEMMPKPPPPETPPPATANKTSLAMLASIISAQKAADEITKNAPKQIINIKRPGDELPDDCKLYVGNLPPAINDILLKQMFSKFGTVLHATVLLDIATNTSRGYGFVHFTNNVSAARAKEEMSELLVEGRPLVVRLRSDGPPSNKSKFGLTIPDEAKLYVAHLPQDITEAALKKLFAPYGEIVDVKLILDKDTGQAKGYGFVNMTSVEGAAAAIQALHGHQVAPGKMLTVRVAGQKPVYPVAMTMPLTMPTMHYPNSLNQPNTSLAQMPLMRPPPALMQPPRMMPPTSMDMNSSMAANQAYYAGQYVTPMPPFPPPPPPPPPPMPQGSAPPGATANYIQGCPIQAAYSGMYYMPTEYESGKDATYPPGVIKYEDGSSKDGSTVPPPPPPLGYDGTQASTAANMGLVKTEEDTVLSEYERFMHEVQDTFPH